MLRPLDLAVSNPLSSTPPLLSSDFCRCRNALLTAAFRTLFPFLSGLVGAVKEGKSDGGGESGTAVAVEEEELEVEVEERREVVGQRRFPEGEWEAEFEVMAGEAREEEGGGEGERRRIVRLR